MHEQRNTKQKNDDKTPQGAVPAYLLDREGQSRAKVLSNMIKQKRKEKAVSISHQHYQCSELKWIIFILAYWQNKSVSECQCLYSIGQMGGASSQSASTRRNRSS